MRPAESIVSPLSAIALFVVLAGLGCQEDNGSVSDGNTSNGTAIVAPATLGGTVDAASFTVPAGQTSTVTSDLTINATGNVVIDGDLIADPSPSGPGYSISITAEGDIDISGMIQPGTSSGQSMLNARIDRRTQGTTGMLDAAGDDGGSLNIISNNGNITIRQSAILVGADGGNATSGPRGAEGGKGGSISFCAPFGRLTMHGRIIVGNGGNGGDASISTDELPAFFPGDDVLQIYTFANKGGNSGALFMTAQSYDIPGLNIVNFVPVLNPTTYNIAANTANIEGGFGGAAGIISILDPPQKLADKFDELRAGPPGESSNSIEDKTKITAAPGGRGWWAGGVGGFITAVPLGWDALHGLPFEIIAGDGGDVTGRPDPDSQCGGRVTLTGAIGGTGGTASGGGITGVSQLTAAGLPNGGNGGRMIVRGGQGGDSDTDAAQTGGKGGNAFATGGAGADGRTSCFSVGNGGNGGIASAFGGEGGDGQTPGHGGDADATGGIGGNGGTGGQTAGIAGTGGDDLAITGADGNTNIPGDAIPQGAEFTGKGPDGTPGQANQLVAPNVCAQIDYDCPWGALCGS